MTFQPLQSEDATLKTAALLERCKDVRMTPEMWFEQRVSWVFGQIGGTLTKDEIRRRLRANG